MSKIQQIEDIESWQKARELTSSVYRCCKNSKLKSDFGFKDQLCRGAVSVMANIAEGFGRHSNKDFANFLYMAKGSATEVISHLYVALDQEYITQEEFGNLKTGYESVIKKLINFIRYLESKPGSRF